MHYLHTALSVNSIAESQHFFEHIFEMRLKVANERPEIGVKFVVLENERGQMIELFEHKDPIPLEQDLMKLNEIGYKHIAFAVDNIEVVIEKAMALGAKVLWEPRVGVTVKRIAFIADPNGLPIELVELE